MFGGDRPARRQEKVWVAGYDTERLVCARCVEEVLQRDVAFYTRTRPGDPFDPWCYQCAHQLMQWAAVGAAMDPVNVPTATADQLLEIVFGVHN